MVRSSPSLEFRVREWDYCFSLALIFAYGLRINVCGIYRGEREKDFSTEYLNVEHYTNNFNYVVVNGKEKEILDF